MELTEIYWSVNTVTI
jgi:Transposase and inactivated derivatives